MLNFVFTARFLTLLALGIGLLSLGWFSRGALYLTILFDLAVFAVAAVDFLISESGGDFQVERQMDERFAMGAENEVRIRIRNRSRRAVKLLLKDEYPAPMELMNANVPPVGAYLPRTGNTQIELPPPTPTPTLAPQITPSATPTPTTR